MRRRYTVRTVIAGLGPPLAERGPIVLILALLAARTVAMVRSAPSAEPRAPAATAEAQALPADADPASTASAGVARQSHVVFIVGSEADAKALRSTLADGGLAGVRDSLVSVVALSGSDAENRAFRAMVFGNEAMCVRTCGHVAMIDLREW